MPTINNAEKLREWFRACPFIAQGRYFGADYLGENPTEYTLTSVPSTLRYRENIKGQRVLQTIQEENFIFAARVPYGNDTAQNLDNLAFFRDVSKWIAERNAASSFPEWDGGTVTAIEAINTGAAVNTGTDAAQYQFQIKVTYRTE